MKIEGWQGPPHVNRVKFVYSVYPLRKTKRVCLFNLFRDKKKKKNHEGLSLLIKMSSQKLHSAPLITDKYVVH